MGWALPKIPSIPLSYDDAAPLLRGIGGLAADTFVTGGDAEGAGPHSAAKTWQGARCGARVHCETLGACSAPVESVRVV